MLSLLFSLCGFAHDAAFEFGDSLYFLHAGEHVRFQKGASQAFDGYPLPFDDVHWSGLEVFQTRIVAALNEDDTHIVFFLSDGRYLVYDAAEKSISTPLALVSDQNWKGLAPFALLITSAYRWNEQHSYFFLSNGQVLRYSHEEKGIEEGYPKPMEETIWKGVQPEWGHITHTVSWNDESVLLFFSSGVYARCNRSTYQIDSGYPKEIEEKRWPGMGDWLVQQPKLSLQAWNGQSLQEGQKISFSLPYHMEEDNCDAPTVPNQRFLASQKHVAFSSAYPTETSAFQVYPIQSNHNDSYERVILQDSSGRFLTTDKGMLVHTTTKEKAEILFLGTNWGAHVVLFHHPQKPLWKDKEKPLLAAGLQPLFFYARGEEVWSKKSSTVCGGSLLTLLLVE